MAKAKGWATKAVKQIAKNMGKPRVPAKLEAELAIPDTTSRCSQALPRTINKMPRTSCQLDAGEDVPNERRHAVTAIAPAGLRRWSVPTPCGGNPCSSPAKPAHRRMRSLIPQKQNDIKNKRNFDELSLDVPANSCPSRPLSSAISSPPPPPRPSPASSTLLELTTRRRWCTTTHTVQIITASMAKSMHGSIRTPRRKSRCQAGTNIDMER
mmetsp:Transcript_82734/g.267920  ORF Transcript_82734/g.267920 Transcript_82734/m.267920 type:complete len:211 (+) Transcript_82734:596-1228(+)